MAKILLRLLIKEKDFLKVLNYDEDLFYFIAIFITIFIIYFLEGVVFTIIIFLKIIIKYIFFFFRKMKGVDGLGIMIDLIMIRSWLLLLE